jgi:hypothetical protein
MTLAPNPPPLSNGNKNGLFLFFSFLAFFSCGSYTQSVKPTVEVENVVNSVPIEPLFLSPNRVMVVSDDVKEYEQKSTRPQLTPPSSFQNSIIQVPIGQDSFHIKPFRIAMVLPFCFGDEHSKNDKIRNVMLEYFEGAETAFQMLSEEGYQVIVDVYDTRNDSMTTIELTKNPLLALADLMIGPVFDVESQIMENFCSVYQISMVNPLRQVEKKSRTSNHIFNPVIVDSNVHFFAALELIRTFPDVHFMLLNDKTSANYTLRKVFLKAFEQEKKPLPFITEDALDHAIHQHSTKQIMVIAPVTEDGIIQKLLSKTAGRNNIQIVGLESWFDLPIIPFQLWKKNNLIFYNQLFIDHSSDESKKFKEKYATLFSAKPGRYAFLGYDHVRFFTESLCMFGTEFGPFINLYQFPLLHNHFRFVKNDHNVFQNTMVNLLQIQDFNITKVP